jgi:hypothetical protein
MAGQLLRNGMRVRLIRLQDWVAGRPPVGSEGTIHQFAGGCWETTFDRIEPKTGYYFGLLGPELPDWLEEIPDKT